MHVKQGLFIEKYLDGAVEVNDSDDGRNGAYILSSDEWISAIAEVASGYPDPAAAVAAARDFHEGRGSALALEAVTATAKLRMVVNATENFIEMASMYCEQLPREVREALHRMPEIEKQHQCPMNAPAAKSATTLPDAAYNAARPHKHGKQF